ncbi:MAG TPA: cupin domain-containing protein [Anaerolineales bacterium]|nr:cupin domain-containing protein [Anaerolineales bacterium]
MKVTHEKQVLKEKITVGAETTKQVLISDTEGPHFAMRKFTIGPNGFMPNHTNTVEHEQFVINGNARISIDGKEFDVEQGSVVFIPANVPHWYKNTGSDNFEFLCVIPNQPDVIKLVD